MVSSTINHPNLSSTGLDAQALKDSILEKLVSSLGKETIVAQPVDWLNATALAVRDRFVGAWMNTQSEMYNRGAKRVYYLSVEYLIGRVLVNAIINLEIEKEVRTALSQLGQDFDQILQLENDPALGNGGLGRLAACYLDSMATLALPGYGYGIRYEFGLFRQAIDNGHQVEQPENWLRYGYPWEFSRPEVVYPVLFGGRVEESRDREGRAVHHWVDTDQVLAMAHDTPIIGYQANSVTNLRLWGAQATQDLHLESFSQGDYSRAVEQKVHSENLSRVLYPPDETESGRELRLRQEFFFTSASIQDILRRHLKQYPSLDNLHEKVVIQLNDTHPALAVPELMRLLVDGHGYDFDQAWSITHQTFAYTNHTLLPEALEKWSVRLVERVLPRHLQIIYELNRRFLDWAAEQPEERRAPAHLVSLIEEGSERAVRMGNLAFLGSKRVNGVSKLHTDLMRRTVFKSFNRLFPERIVNVTNGVTPRRWVHLVNPELSQLITDRIGSGWIRDLDRLSEFGAYADDQATQQAVQEIRRHNKERLARQLVERTGIQVHVDSLFDVQIKRIHEYKRQLLNILETIARYQAIKDNPKADWVPRTKLMAGKAASSYFLAKLIIKLANDVAETINNDPDVSPHLKMVFVPNYNVTTAEYLIPASDLSEQLSTAGKEASGTGNMKFALNGALTIGTLDGANVEIRDLVGEENIFIFGMTADRVEEIRNAGDYDPETVVRLNAQLRRVIEAIRHGHFNPGQPHLYQPLIDSLLHGGDTWFVLADFDSYVEAQGQVDQLYRDPAAWTHKSILNTSAMGFFSSDRSVRDYARHIWDVQPIHQTPAAQAAE